METLASDDGISDDWVKLSGRIVVGLFLEILVSSLAVQMAQSGQFTLELPYAIIGLGATPNFVERITIAIPPSKDSVCSLSYTHTLSYIHAISDCH